MALRKEGDWDCPTCGMLVFASKDSCPKCDRGGGGGWKEGDWECPECGHHVFASKETCPKCNPGARTKGTVRPGDWVCPECNMLNFASRDTCFKGCGKGTAKKDTGGNSKVATLITSNAALGALAKASPAYKACWIAYCKRYGKGFSDPSKYDADFINAFLEYSAELVQASLEHEETEEATKRPVAEFFATQRAAKAAKVCEEEAAPTSSAEAAPPAQKKKLTMKKAVNDEIQRLNAGGELLAPIRLGAVAAALAQLSVAASLEILARLEGSQSEIEDPNVWIREQATA